MRNKVAEMRGRPVRAGVRIVDMPEVQAAVDRGLARAELHVPLSTGGLGPVAIVLAADEEIVARAPFEVEDDAGTVVEAEAILIVKRDALPALKLGADDPRLPDLARVLAREAAGS